MKKLTLILALSAALAACHNEGQKDYTQYVNLMIGTGGHGHTNPAALVPHGMIQPGPDTRIHGWDACTGYYYDDDSINGFAHTRLSGTGCADYGDFLLMPTVGEQEVRYVGEKEENQHVAFASAFKHENETAEPGYYSVLLDRYGIRAEMTATDRAAIHRYTFPESAESGLILDLDYAIQEQTTLGMEVEVLNDTTLQAFRRSNWWQYDQRLYFRLVTSKPFTYDIYRDTIQTASGKQEPRCKVLLRFPTAEGEQVMVKASYSACDYEGAERNLTAEMPAWDFDGTRQKAHDRWNEALSKIDIETDDADQRIIFYTALYHTHYCPTLFQDVDGRYLGQDLQIHQSDEPYYTNFSLWDTFRATHPLMTIIEPELNEAYIRTLISKGEEGGLVPKWDCGSNYTGCMKGYHFNSLVADAYAKGCRNFDVQLAYKHMLRSAEYSTEGITPACPEWLYPYIMPEARRLKMEYGYVPCDKSNESVAEALESCYDDWCITVLADDLGDKENAEKYKKYAATYREYFDPVTGYMRGKTSQGQWREPFDPAHSNHREDDYCEGNAYQWSWFVLHDVPGLVETYGGKEKFIEKLDALFSASSELRGELISADISGLIGQYAHGNEPSHHIIHLYNYVDQPWRTQELTDQVLQTLYFNNPDGLSGNEDCGQMSAWYIMNAMGFYQVCPGRPVYSIGRPLFKKVTIHQPNGKDFVIEAAGNTKATKYVSAMTLNGKKLDTPFFTHDDITRGGKMEFAMTAQKPEGK